MNLFVKLIIFISYVSIHANDLNISTERITANSILHNSKNIENNILSMQNLDFKKIEEYELLLLDYRLIDKNIVFMQQIVNRSIELYGIDALETKIAYLNLAHAYIIKDDLVSANSIFGLVTETIENFSYEKNIYLKIKLLYTKANYSFISGSFGESKKSLLSILELIKEHLGENNILYLKTLHRLAQIDLHLGAYDEGINYIKKISKINNKYKILLSFREEGNIQITLARILNKQQKYIQAQHQLLNILKKIKDSNSTQQPITIKLLKEFSISLISTGSFEIASKNIKYAIDIQKVLNIKDNLDTVSLWVIKGISEKYLRHYTKANESFRKALKILDTLNLSEEEKNQREKSIQSLLIKVKIKKDEIF